MQEPSDFLATLTTALPSVMTGLTLSLSLIMAIGAQNTFAPRQGLRREHVAAVVAVCALLEITLMTIGVSGPGRYPGQLSACLERAGTGRRCRGGLVRTLGIAPGAGTACHACAAPGSAANAA